MPMLLRIFLLEPGGSDYQDPTAVVLRHLSQEFFIYQHDNPNPIIRTH